MAGDFNKPVFEVDASEILIILRELDTAIKNVQYWTSDQKVSSDILLPWTCSKIKKEAKGQVLILAPWNYPFNLSLVPLIAAWSAGNRIILKPSEFAPNSAVIIDNIIRNCFTAEEVDCFLGGADLGAFLTQMGFDHIFFTGSKHIGAKVMASAAHQLSSVTLELGGKNPFILDDSVNLEDSVEKIMHSKYLNAGQTCIACDYLILPKKMEQEFLKLWNIQLLKWFPEQISHCQDYCSMINRKHFDRILNMVNRCQEQGAELISDLDYDETTLRIKPILLKNSEFHHASMEEEIFGPVLPVITYQDSIEEVLPAIKRIDRPLVLYVFSNRKSFIKYITDHLKSGGMSVNNSLLNYCEPNLPFGGSRHSGYGYTLGYFGFRTFVHERAVAYQRTGFNVLSFFYPPYNSWKKKLLKWITWYFS